MDTPNDRLLDANGHAQRALWLQTRPTMTGSGTLMEMLRERYGYGLAQNDRLLDANGQRALWLWTCPKLAACSMSISGELSMVTDWPQMTGSWMPLEMLSDL